MPLMRLLFVASLLLLVCPATHAQDWREPYARGDYERAAEMLHETITGTDIATIEPSPLQQLAAIYAEGRGVPVDPVMACALAQFAEGQAMSIGGPRYLSETTRAAEIKKRYCTNLTADERLEVLEQSACFPFNMRAQVIELAGRSIRIGPRGLSFPEEPREIRVPFGCLDYVAALRTTTVPPPQGAIHGVKPRHFIEVFMWSLRGPNGADGRVLTWSVAELRDNKLGSVVMDQPLSVEATRKWPRPGLPEEVESRLSFEMIRSGQVRWRLAGSKPRHGWILLPEEQIER